MHGFTSATAVHDIADMTTAATLIALYCGDYDPAASTCQSTICPTGSTNTKATTSISNGLL